MVCEICGKTMYWCLGHAPWVHPADAAAATQEGENHG